MSWLGNLFSRWSRTEVYTPLDRPRTVSNDPLLSTLFDAVGIAPKPAVRAEQFADVKAPDEQTVPYARLVRGNNASVTRNYGKGDVDESTARERALAEKVGGVLSPEELSALRRFDVHVGDGEVRFDPKNAEEIVRRHQLRIETVKRLGEEDRAHGKFMATKG